MIGSINKTNIIKNNIFLNSISSKNIFILQLKSFMLPFKNLTNNLTKEKVNESFGSVMIH